MNFLLVFYFFDLRILNSLVLAFSQSSTRNTLGREGRTRTERAKNVTSGQPHLVWQLDTHTHTHTHTHTKRGFLAPTLILAFTQPLGPILLFFPSPTTLIDAVAGRGRTKRGLVGFFYFLRICLVSLFSCLIVCSWSAWCLMGYVLLRLCQPPRPLCLCSV